MVLFIIGLGLGDEKDITLNGLEAIKTCEKIYLEYYTSILGVNKDKLEELYGKKVIEADREMVEETMDQILDEIALDSEKVNSAILVVGDPFCATTHTDLYLRALKRKIEVKVIHNASIVNAVGCCGMQVYRFGEIVSIPLFTEKWRPYSFIEKIHTNVKVGLHTLVLLDIKVKERTEENLLKGKKIYEPPTFMDTRTAAKQLLEAEESTGKKILSEETKCFGLARIGQKDQKVTSGTLKEFATEIYMGGPLHSMVICSPELHIIETEMYDFFHYSGEKLIQKELLKK